MDWSYASGVSTTCTVCVTETLEFDQVTCARWTMPYEPRRSRALERSESRIPLLSDIEWILLHDVVHIDCWTSHMCRFLESDSQVTTNDSIRRQCSACEYLKILSKLCWKKCYEKINDDKSAMANSHACHSTRKSAMAFAIAVARLLLSNILN